MTKPLKSGGTNKITVEGDLNELKSDRKTDVHGEGYDYTAQMETEGVRIEDGGSGQTITIRTFEFKMNPDPKMIKQFPKDNQELFNAHAKQISTILWGDGLTPLESVPPRVIIDRKKLTYRIFIAAQANRSNTFMQKANSLSEHLKNGTTRHRV